MPLTPADGNDWNDQEKRAIASYHEAGHAVVGTLLADRMRRRVVRITLLLPPGPPAGAEMTPLPLEVVRASALGPCTPDLVELAEAHVAWAWAGPAAEFRYTGWENGVGLRMDAIQADGWLRTLVRHGVISADAVQDRLEAIHERMLALLDQHWSMVETVARAMEARGSVDGAEIERVVGGPVATW